VLAFDELELRLLPEHVGVAGDVDRDAVDVLEFHDVAAFLVQEVVGDLVGSVMRTDA
jgi:hypothetical protein